MNSENVSTDKYRFSVKKIREIPISTISGSCTGASQTSSAGSKDFNIIISFNGGGSSSLDDSEESSPAQIRPVLTQGQAGQDYSGLGPDSNDGLQDRSVLSSNIV